MPKERETERSMLDRLHRRYNFIGMGARRYVVAEKVPTSTGGAMAIADFVAFDAWPSKFEFHGHEVKVSRSDWLTELKNPWKSEAMKRYMNRWWLVIADAAMVKEGELPDDWGLMVPNRGAGVRVVKEAPPLSPIPMTTRVTAGLLRAVQKTAGEPGFVEYCRTQHDTTMGELKRHNARLLRRVEKAEREQRQMSLELISLRLPS